MRFRSVLPVFAAGILLLALPARAHEVHHDVERGRAVAVRIHHGDGHGMANAEAEVYSPADPGTPHWKGRTDRNGFVAFVPDVPGKWRVRVVDSTGHGLDTTVDVPSPGEGHGHDHADEPGSTALQLRPLLGVAVIAAVFGLLVVIGRRKRS